MSRRRSNHSRQGRGSSRSGSRQSSRSSSRSRSRSSSSHPVLRHWRLSLRWIRLHAVSLLIGLLMVLASLWVFDRQMQPPPNPETIEVSLAPLNRATPPHLA